MQYFKIYSPYSDFLNCIPDVLYNCLPALESDHACQECQGMSRMPFKEIHIFNHILKMFRFLLSIK